MKESINKRFLQVDPAEVTPRTLNGYMLGSIGPRPIAFASTVDKIGNPNLAPFSFFNCFGIKPPILIFSPSRRGKDNTTKHTYQNIKETAEVVINVVSYNMVQQMNLASSSFPKGVNEFEKAGFTMEPSVKVKPFRVKESPVQFECKVIRVVETGDQGYAGNLIVCRVELMHINEDVLNEEGRINQDKIDLVGRLGGNLYCRASGNSVFEIPMPVDYYGIGIDALPKSIRNSEILTGNDLGRLGSIENFPSEDEVKAVQRLPEVDAMLLKANEKDGEVFLHRFAKEMIDKDDPENALKLLLLNELKMGELWK